MIGRSAVGAILVNEMRILRRDPESLVVLVAMPIVVMALLRGSLADQLQLEGYANANGAELAVPGSAVLFGLFAISLVGYGFFREYRWGTAERLRASPLSTAEIVVGKFAAPILTVALQLIALFAAGTLLFDLEIAGSVVGVAIIAASFTLCLVAAGAALFAVCRTYQQLNAIANLAAVLLAGIAGAIVPFATLPDWARGIAPATPAYWAMEGFTRVVLEGHGFAATLVPAAVMLAMAALFTAIAVRAFDAGDGKQYLD